MKLKQIIYVALALGFLASCNDDDIQPTYTVGEADNTIVLRAGVSEGGSGVQTRAVDDESNHAKHTPFAENTIIALRMDGQWVGHDPVNIKKKTNATLGAASGTGNLHNELKTFTPQFYWDDYGTADPNNTSGRAQGLTIYGAAINKVINTSNWPTALSGLDNTSDKWKNISWTVETNQNTNGIINSDLLTSNNVVYRSTLAEDNAYKFESRNNGKLLVFTHAMSKVTVVLTAGEGFPRTTDSDPATAYFENEPNVTLKNFYNSGTVDVEAKVSTPTTSSTPDISMYRETPATWANSHTATYEAVVFPGKAFADNDQILSFSVDGNSFNVTAKKLNEAIQKAIDRASGNTATADYPTDKGMQLLQAWNYKLQITVNKTALGISATIEDWNEVEAAEDKPKINVTQTYGHTGGAFTNDFDFFRSTTKASGYSKDAYVAYDNGKYTFHNQLYWPNHNTHYFFRGVYPRVQINSEAGWIPSGKVSTSTGSASTIAVENVGFSAGRYPSELAFGWPKTVDSEGKENGDDEICKVHSNQEGICATEGNIYMNFKYVMSKVQFSLKSTGVDGKDKVDLSNVTVEIINGNKTAKIRLSDGLHENFVAGDKGNYTLNQLTTAEAGFDVTTLDAIVPQELDNDVKVRITVKDGSGLNVLDVYEAQLNKIKVKTNDNSGTEITEWKPGNYYKYELDIKKTAINVTATLKDWDEVTASDDIWF